MSQEYTFLHIKPGPAHARTGATIDAVQPLYLALAGLLAEKPQLSLSLEIWAAAGTIRFVIVVPSAWTEVVEQHIYASYPAALVDQTSEFDLVSDDPIVGATFSFGPEDASLKVDGFSEGDTLSPLMEVLASAPPAATICVQLTLRAAKQKTPLFAALARSLSDGIREEGKRLVLGSWYQAKIVDAVKESKFERALFQAAGRVVVRGPDLPTADRLARQVTAAFHQFTLSGEAVLQISPVRRLQPFLRELHERRFPKAGTFWLTLEEAQLIYHLPTPAVAAASLERVASVYLAPPSFARQAGLELGVSTYRHKTAPVVVSPEDRLRHLYLIGQTGTGKSTLFQSAMLQDIERGEGCCYIDPHGEAIDWLLARIPAHRTQDVLLFDPSDTSALLGMNLLEWHEPAERDLLIQELINLFYKLFDPNHSGVIGPQFEHWLRSAALTITEPGVRGTLVDIPRLFTDDGFRRAVLARAEHPAVKAFWHEQMAQTAAFHKSEMLNYFTSKFGSFLGNQTMQAILSQRHSAFQLRALMDKKKILLVNLSKGRLGEQNAQLLGIILMAKLQMAAMSRADTPRDARPPFYVYIDEFHNLATDTFASMLSEVRKYGVALHLTHQYADQLSPTIRQAIAGNVGTILALRLGLTDAEWLAPHFQPLTCEDLTNVAKHEFHMRTLVNGTVTMPFTAKSVIQDREPTPQVAETIRQRIRTFVAAYGEYVAVNSK